MRRRLTDWVAGILFGIVVGAIGLAFPLFAIIFVLALATISLRSGARLTLWAGVSIGIGAGSAGLLGLATYSCARIDAEPNQACTQPDLAPWLVGAALFFAVGAAGSVVALVRVRQGS